MGKITIIIFLMTMAGIFYFKPYKATVELPLKENTEGFAAEEQLSKMNVSAEKCYEINLSEEFKYYFHFEGSFDEKGYHQLNPDDGILACTNDYRYPEYKSGFIFSDCPEPNQDFFK